MADTYTPVSVSEAMAFADEVVAVIEVLADWVIAADPVTGKLSSATQVRTAAVAQAVEYLALMLKDQIAVKVAVATHPDVRMRALIDGAIGAGVSG
jgi:hypothetical protein